MKLLCIDDRLRGLFIVLLGLLPTGAAHGGSIFVTNFSAGTIGEYTTSGATVNASLITGLSEPFGIAIVDSSPEPSTHPLNPALSHSSDSVLEYSNYAGVNAPQAKIAIARQPPASAT
jgi:hypothetical protein